MLTALGWIGNGLFFSRFLVQWVASERARAVVVPSVFWWLSLAGSIATAAYAAGVGEPVLLIGTLLNAGLYVRNLLISSANARGTAVRKLGPRVATAVGVGLLVITVLVALWKSGRGSSATPVWIGISIVGQSLWSARFVLQWIRAERTGESRLTPVFWWVGLGGSVCLLSYAIHLRDAVFIAGYAVTPLLQIRNLLLPQSRSPETTEDGSTPAAETSATRA